jgi:hypothetical protein
MTETQTWIIIGFIGIVIVGFGINIYNNSIQAKVNKNVANSKQAGYTKAQAGASCGAMCSQAFGDDVTDNQTCVSTCEKTLGISSY